MLARYAHIRAQARRDAIATLERSGHVLPNRSAEANSVESLSEADKLLN
jgi:hypothetical protein